MDPLTLEPVAIVEETDPVADWRTLYRDFLTNGLLPETKQRHEGFIGGPSPLS
jgi:hypothetical protein